MKKSIISLILLSPFATLHASDTLIAYWDFNMPFSFPDKSVQIIHSASSGNGFLYQQRADTDGNGKTGNAYANVDYGINSTAGLAMAWDDIAKSGDNDAEFFMTFSTLSLTNVTVSFDIRGNTSIIPSFDLKYSLNSLVDVTNPGAVIGTIKDFSGGISTEIFNNQPLAAGASYQRVTMNLGSITALNNQAYVALRIDDFDDGTGNNDLRIDNILITAIPEPSATMFGAMSLFALLRRRRK
jgi:hypothetical protein